MTKYEEEILTIINASKNHMTIDEVYNALKAKEPKAVLATAYNNVNKLVRDGKIKRLSIEGHIDRYDNISRHDHLVCRKCGGISDFSFSNLTSKLERELGEAIEGYDLRIHYVCKACKMKDK